MNHMIMDALNVLWWMARQHLVPLTLMIEQEYKAGRKVVWVREGHRQHLSVGGQNPPPGEQPYPSACGKGEKTNEKGMAIAGTRTAMSGGTETDRCVQEQSLSPAASVWIVAELHCIRSLHKTGFLPCHLLSPSNILNLQLARSLNISHHRQRYDY